MPKMAMRVLLLVSTVKGDDIDASAVCVKVKHADVTTTAVKVDDMDADCHTNVT